VGDQAVARLEALLEAHPEGTIAGLQVPLLIQLLPEVPLVKAHRAKVPQVKEVLVRVVLVRVGLVRVRLVRVVLARARLVKEVTVRVSITTVRLLPLLHQVLPVVPPRGRIPVTEAQKQQLMVLVHPDNLPFRM